MIPSHCPLLLRSPCSTVPSRSALLLYSLPSIIDPADELLIVDWSKSCRRTFRSFADPLLLHSSQPTAPSKSNTWREKESVLLLLCEKANCSFPPIVARFIWSYFLSNVRAFCFFAQEAWKRDHSIEPTSPVLFALVCCVHLCIILDCIAGVALLYDTSGRRALPLSATKHTDSHSNPSKASSALLASSFSGFCVLCPSLCLCQAAARSSGVATMSHGQRMSTCSFIRGET